MHRPYNGRRCSLEVENREKEPGMSTQEQTRPASVREIVLPAVRADRVASGRHGYGSNARNNGRAAAP